MGVNLKSLIGKLNVLTRTATGGGKIKGRFDDAAMFDAIATVIDAKAKPLTGEVTITWAAECDGAMTLKSMMLKVDTNKTGATKNYDYANSDFDNDGKLNKDDKFPFDPAKS